MERQLTRTMRHRLSQFPELDLDKDWLDAVITVGKKGGILRSGGETSKRV
jgi:hypothetical protein